MLEASDARLVLKWTCRACGYINYFAGSTSGRFSEELAEAAEAMGCDPEDLAIMPDVIYCAKCEEPHKLPEGFEE